MNGTRHGVFVKGTSYSHRVCVYQSYHLIKCARQLLTTYSRWSEKNADSTVIKPLLSFRRTNFRRRHRGRATKLKMRRIEKKNVYSLRLLEKNFNVGLVGWGLREWQNQQREGENWNRSGGENKTPFRRRCWILILFFFHTFSHFFIGAAVAVAGAFALCLFETYSSKLFLFVSVWDTAICEFSVFVSVLFVE